MISQKVNVFVHIFKFKLFDSQSLVDQISGSPSLENETSISTNTKINLLKMKPFDDFQQERILTQASLVDWGFIRQALHAKLSSLRGEGGFNHPSITAVSPGL